MTDSKQNKLKEALARLEANVNALKQAMQERSEKAVSRSVKEYYKGRLEAYDQMLLMIHMLE